MKTRQIEVDEQVFKALGKMIQSFDDTPNSVLARLLGLSDNDGSPLNLPGERAKAGELLSEREYVIPILKSLEAHGGSATIHKVTSEVGERLKSRFTAKDREKLPSGTDIRWENRVAFTRLRMVEQGLLKRGSPRGTWEITQKGRDHLKQRGPDSQK